MYLTVVSLRAMFNQSVHDTNNTNRTTRTNVVTGRWYLSGEHERVYSA